jgi:hypothetical protein
MNKLPFDVIRIIIEYTDNIDLKIYYGVYNKINILLFHNIERVLWKDIQDINISLSQTKLYSNIYYNMNLTKIVNYNLPNLINLENRRETNDLIRIYYSESSSNSFNKKIYFKEIYIHRLKSNFDNKFNRKYYDLICNNYYENYNWNTIITKLISYEPFL